MSVLTEIGSVEFANKIAKKCEMPQRVECIQEINSDFVLLVYYAIMGELPDGILTEARSKEAQVHNISCTIKVLEKECLQTSLSHISPKRFVESDPVAVYNLLEIFDGLTEFMIDYMESKTSKQAGSSTTFISLNSETDSNKFITKEKLAIIDIDDSSFHELEPSKSLEEFSLSESSSKNQVKSLQNISLSTVEGDLKASYSSKDSLLTDDVPNDTEEGLCSPKLVHKKQPAKRNLISRFESLALDNDFKNDVPNTKNLSEDKENSDEYASLYNVTDGVDVLDGKDTKLQVDCTDDDNVVKKNVPVNVTFTTDKENEFLDSIKQNKTSKTQDATIPLTSDEKTSQETNNLSSSKCVPEKRDWHHLMENLQQTVEESRRIREKYYSKKSSASSNSSCNSIDKEQFDIEETSTCDKDDSFTDIASKQHSRKVRFDSHVDVSSPANAGFECQKDPQSKFNSVLNREDQLQKLKNKLLECSYKNQLQDVNDAANAKIKPLRRKTTLTEQNLKSILLQDRKRLLTKKSRKSSTEKFRKAVGVNAKRKGFCVPTVRKVPQRRAGGPIKKKIRTQLKIGEHDLLPTLLQQFPGLELSKQTLDNAWKKQFRQIENLTKMQNNHLQKKRTSDLKLQEAHRGHQLLTEIMRREHEQTQRVREKRRSEDEERKAMRQVQEKKQQTARVRRYFEDYHLQMKSKMLKRRTREEKIFKHLFEEGLEIQKHRLSELRKYARDKRKLLQNHQKNQIESLENYYKDQFDVLAENLQQEKRDLTIRDKAQSDLVRKMKSGLRKKMSDEICELQKLIVRDDDDVHFREIEGDRVRRQLQLATYHAKFNRPSSSSVAGLF